MIKLSWRRSWTRSGIMSETFDKPSNADTDADGNFNADADVNADWYWGQCWCWYINTDADFNADSDVNADADISMLMLVQLLMLMSMLMMIWMLRMMLISMLMLMPMLALTTMLMLYLHPDWSSPASGRLRSTTFNRPSTTSARTASPPQVAERRTILIISTLSATCDTSLDIKDKDVESICMWHTAGNGTSEKY